MVKAVDKHYHWWCLYMIVQSEVNTGNEPVCYNYGDDDDDDDYEIKVKDCEGKNQT